MPQKYIGWGPRMMQRPDCDRQLPFCSVAMKALSPGAHLAASRPEVVAALSAQ